MWFLVSGVCIGVWVAGQVVCRELLSLLSSKGKAEESRAEQSRGTEAVCPV